jgi:hypothetical protein
VAAWFPNVLCNCYSVENNNKINNQGGAGEENQYRFGILRILGERNYDV